MNSDARFALRRMSRITLLAATAWLLVSCSRALPTAPRTAVGAQATNHALLIGTEGEVVVTLASGADANRLASDYGATLAEVEDAECTLVPGAGETPDTLALRLSADPRVVTSERNSILESPEARQESFAFDDGFGANQSYQEQPATSAINLTNAHRMSDGSGVTVAVLDTGIDPNHPAFAGRIAGGWDFVQNDADPTDQRDGVDNDGDGYVDEAYGHGTHVAGIVALTAPGARLLIVRVLDADGRGDVLNVAAGIRWAVAHGARVINMSLGMLNGSDAIRAAMEMAEANGVMCVASAGNWGSENPQEFPARVGDAAAVAAVDAGAHPATFTSFGSFVALSAPGVGVRSAYPGGTYRLWSGTSMSSPFVAGAAALVLAENPGFSPDDVRQQLTSTAQPIQGANSAQVGKLGAGMLDAAAAVGYSPAGEAGGPSGPGERLPGR